MSHTDIPLRCVDHVRFFVGNARQSAYFYRNAFGFDVIAYAGLETKTRHEAGYVLRQGNITFVLTSPLGPAHHDAYRIVTHGDGAVGMQISQPMGTILVRRGIDSISLNADTVVSTIRSIASLEQRMKLDGLRRTDG